MHGIKRVLLVMVSTLAPTVVALVIYFLVARPGLISLILFTMVAQVFLILGLGPSKPPEIQIWTLPNST
jgi:hypothetical protein